ncbi:hypothetical protein N9R27_03300 [Flavobacteriaceae bacterium]|nr:hypothetical protein [Flavobacteriaceae bacterium]
MPDLLVESEVIQVMVELRINSERLWQSILDMAAIGATDKGGCNCQALTDGDREARTYFANGVNLLAVPSLWTRWEIFLHAEPARTKISLQCSVAAIWTRNRQVEGLTVFTESLLRLK